MQKSYYKFTIFTLTTAVLSLFLLNGAHVRPNSTHLEVQHFYKLSPAKWEYNQIRSIEYTTIYHHYKVKTKDGDFFTTGFYNQSPTEKIPQMMAFIAEKAQIKIDTVADYREVTAMRLITSEILLPFAAQKRLKAFKNKAFSPSLTTSN